jgi:hypothetical protein
VLTTPNNALERLVNRSRVGAAGPGNSLRPQRLVRLYPGPLNADVGRHQSGEYEPAC